MKLYIVKPDLYFFDQYNDMMKEWNESGTRIAPWFLDKPFDSLEDFAEFIQMLDCCENANQPKKFSSASSYFVIDENDRLIGATSLKRYLTMETNRTWGHIGCGVRPSERKKWYAVQILKRYLKKLSKEKCAGSWLQAILQIQAPLRLSNAVTAGLKISLTTLTKKAVKSTK